MTEETEHFHPALIQFSRTYNATYDNMDFTLMYGSKDDRIKTSVTGVDAILEGLSGTILHQQHVTSIDTIDTKAYETALKKLVRKFQRQTEIIQKLIQLADVDQPIDDVLGGYAQEKTLVFKHVELWSNVDTTIVCEPQIGVGYHRLELKGTNQSIQNALIYILYRMIREYTTYPNSQNDIVKNLVRTEIKRMIRYKKHPDRFNTYILPWITTLQSLD